MKTKYNINFKQKNIIITGGAGYLGSKLALSFKDLGGNVFVIDKDWSSKKKILKKFKSKKIKVIEADLSNPDNIKNIYTKFKKKKIKISCLINNASYNNSNFQNNYTGKLSQQSFEVFNESIKVNLAAPFLMSKFFSNIMLQSANPSIINVSSIYSLIAPDFNLYEGTKMGNSAAYSSAKAGLNQLTVWFSSVLAPKIRVNSVSPGGIYRNQKNSFQKKYKKKCLLGRMATEQDVVGPIIFLASNYSNYITGQNIIIDGGYSVT